MRSLLDATLTIAAVAASLLAIVVVIALVWWVRSLSPATPPEVLVQNPPVPVPRSDVAQPRSMATPARQVAPPVQRAAAPAASPPTAAAAGAPEMRGGNDDAAKNRALGAALSRLGDDPELQRKLREAVTQAAP